MFCIQGPFATMAQTTDPKTDLSVTRNIAVGQSHSHGGCRCIRGVQRRAGRRHRVERSMTAKIFCRSLRNVRCGDMLQSPSPPGPVFPPGGGEKKKKKKKPRQRQPDGTADHGDAGLRPVITPRVFTSGLYPIRLRSSGTVATKSRTTDHGQDWSRI